MGCPGTSWPGHENSSNFFAVGNKPKLFNRPDITAMIYNQFASSIMREQEENSKQYFGTRYVVVAWNLEFQARNTLYHHILLVLEGGLIDDVEKSDGIISTELSMAEQDRNFKTSRGSLTPTVTRHTAVEGLVTTNVNSCMTQMWLLPIPISTKHVIGLSIEEGKKKIWRRFNTVLMSPKDINTTSMWIERNVEILWRIWRKSHLNRP